MCVPLRKPCMDGLRLKRETIKLLVTCKSLLRTQLVSEKPHLLSAHH